MAPRELIIGLVVVGVLIYNITDFAKNPGEQKKKKHFRSIKSPVPSNQELFDAFGYKPELKDGENTEEK